MRWVWFVFVLLSVLCVGCATPEWTNTTEPFLDKNGKLVTLPDGSVAMRTIITKKESNWPLHGKGFTAHQNAFFLKVESTGSAQTGSVMPNVDLAFGDGYMNDIPMIEFDQNQVTLSKDAKTFANYSEYLHVQRSAWPWISDFSVIDYDRKSAGAGAPSPSVKLTVNASNNATSQAQASPSALAPGISQETFNDAADAAKEWLSEPKNKEQLKSWASKAWSWLSYQFR